MATATNRTLWFSLLAAALIYMAIPFLVAPPGASADIAPMLSGVLAIVSAGIATATIVVRRSQLTTPIQQRTLDLSSPEGLGKAVTPFILCLVLSESIGIFGLVLSFLSGEPLYALAFGVACLALLWFHRPTAPELNPPPSSAERALDPRALR